ncbi:MAG: hypothetical protein ABI175_16960, partial [Polyangiales bacterium]
LALVTLATASLVTLAAAGCGKTDASAATTEGTGGAPAGPKAEQPAGPKAKGDEWNAEAKVIAPTGAEKLYTLEVVLTASKSWHVNPEYPFKFKAAGSDVEFKQVDFKKDDPAFKLEKCVKTDKGGDECSELRLTVKFSAANAKTAKAGGELKFGVCSADKCKIDKAPLAVAVTPGKTS